MAERRMLAKTIIDSDMFLEMPLSSQALYFHLSMRADDDGFINNPKRIQRMAGASDDDLKILIAKNFLIPFESGIVVIKHWRIHNYIQSDRYKKTVYQEEMKMLKVNDNKAYTLDVNNMDTSCIQHVSNVDTECIQDGYSLETQVRLGKDSIGEDRVVEDRLVQDIVTRDIESNIEPEKENAKKKKASANASAPFFDNPELEKTFRDFIEMRKKIKKPMTDRAIELMIKHLRDMAGNDDTMSIAILNQSIIRSWADIYHLKEPYSGAGTNNRGQPLNIPDRWEKAARDAEALSTRR